MRERLRLFPMPAPLHPSRVRSLRRARGEAAVALLALPLALGLFNPPSAMAIPRLDLGPYPAAAKAERRWVVQLPSLPPPDREPGPSSEPADWRVELIVGRNALVDCNLHRFSGRIRRASLPGSTRSVLRVEDVTPMASTRMACPPDQPMRRLFVPMGGEPLLLPYDRSEPIVVYIPADLELRWRLWRADRRSQSARQL
jgi:ecotin